MILQVWLSWRPVAGLEGFLKPILVSGWVKEELLKALNVLI